MASGFVAFGGSKNQERFLVLFFKKQQCFFLRAAYGSSVEAGLRAVSRKTIGRSRNTKMIANRIPNADKTGGSPPGVDPVAHEGAQEAEGGADSQIRHGKH